MNIPTTRFGTVAIDAGDVLTFADGLIGMEDCCRWTLLADAQNTALGWLQSIDRADVALAVVCPQRFVPDYRVRVSRRDVRPLGLSSPSEAQVLVIVNQVHEKLTVNLKAPLVIHLANGIGRQIVAKDDHLVRHPLGSAAPLRKSA